MSATPDSFFAGPRPRPQAGMPPYVPSDKDRANVMVWAGCQVPHRTMAIALDIDAKTLRKHFRKELDEGAAKLECWAVGHLYKHIKNGSLAALTYLLDRRFGYHQTINVNGLGGGIGAPVDVVYCTDEQLERIIAEEEAKERAAAAAAESEPQPQLCLPAPGQTSDCTA